MERQVEQIYSFQSLGEVEVENTVFVACQFIQTNFQKARFKNCMFIACNFSLASFGESQWKRCTFQASEFIHAKMDRSSFRDCHANLSNFNSVDFNRCKFGFVGTDYCDFTVSKIDKLTYIPAGSREFIGEVIRQSSDRPQIQAFSAMVRVCKEFCWETLTHMGRHFLKEEDQQIVIKALKKFSNFDKLLIKFYHNRGLLFDVPVESKPQLS